MRTSGEPRNPRKRSWEGGGRDQRGGKPRGEPRFQKRKNTQPQERDPFKKALREQENFERNNRPTPKLDEIDTAEVERLEFLFADKRARMSPEERRRLDAAQERSHILESALTESAKRLFGNRAEVVLPTRYDDYKNATDAVLIFRNAEGAIESAVAIDFATQQDVDGYIEDGQKAKGLEKKWKRSLQGIAEERQRMTHLKYLTSKNPKTNVVETVERSHIPRVILGLADSEIKRIGDLWGSGGRDRGFDLSKDAALVQLSQSLYRQLLAQLYVAKMDAKAKGKTLGTTTAETSLLLAITAIKGVKKPEGSDGVRRVVDKSIAPTDAVLRRIHEVTRPQALAVLFGEAKQDAQEMQRRFDAGEFKKIPKEAAMTPEDWAKLEASLIERKVDADVRAHIEDFLQERRTTFFSWCLPMVAAAVPVRIWMRLTAGAKKTNDERSPEFAESQEFFAKKVAQVLSSVDGRLSGERQQLYEREYAPLFARIARARTLGDLTKIFPERASGAEHEAVQNAILKVKGFGVLPMNVVLQHPVETPPVTSGQPPVPPTTPPVMPPTPAQSPKNPTEAPRSVETKRLSYEQHLNIIKEQVKMDKEKYAKYDTKNKRIKSWLGEKLGTLFGAQTGALAGGMLAWCAGALAIPATIGGAVLGAYLINKYMRHKGMDPESRMRVVALQKLALKAEAEPYTYASIMSSPEKVEKFIKRDMLYRKLGSAAVMAGIGGLASASMLHYRTGGAIWSEIGKSAHSGNWSNVWALFYCNPNGRGARAVANHIPQGRGGIVQQHLQSSPRYTTPRLSFQNHMSCIGRCQSPYGMGQFNAAFSPGGSRYVPTTVRTFGSGRWNG